MGRVGCGKTTLLDLIAGQFNATSGTISLRNNSICYVDQDTVVFSGSIRFNITLELPMNKKFYQMVLEYCCLLEDLSSMPEGDQTIISQKSNNVSGGQRARIVLARAIYSKK